MLKKWLVLLLLVLQTLGGATGWAQVQVPAKPEASSGLYVQDYAGVLTSKSKQYLQTLGRDLDRKTTAQVVVVTVPSLKGAALDEYALTLLRDWGIGQKDKNNGVLLLIAINDHKSRIEVGYGLEGILPDGKTGRIQDEYMLPYFKKGQYDAGIVQGYQATAQVIAKAAGVSLKAKGSATSQPPVSSKGDSFGWPEIILLAGLAGLLILDQIFLGGALLRLLLMFFFRGGGRGRGGGGGFGGGSGGGGGSSRSW